MKHLVLNVTKMVISFKLYGAKLQTSSMKG